MSTVKIESGDYHIQVLHDADTGGLQIIALLDGKPIGTIGVKDGRPTCHLFEAGQAVGSLALVDGQPVLFDRDCKQVHPAPYTLAADPSHLLN